MTQIIADDLFAGAGGWDVGAHLLGIHARGVENMKEARATRDAAGLETIHDDVWTFVPDGKASVLIASPPCQTFSAAGKGAGRRALDDVLELVEMGTYADVDRMRTAAETLGDERTALVLTPLHFATQYEQYDTLAWEQVPPVLPVWEACAEVLRGQGWNVWTGLVYAEQYGVPQTRKRAVLIASRTREVGRPKPTHSRYHARTPGKLDEDVAKWVSMAEALGCPETLEMISNYGTGGDPKNRGVRLATQPAPTVTPKVDRTKWATHMGDGPLLSSPSGITGPVARPVSAPAATVTGADNYYIFTRDEWERRNPGRPFPTHMGDVYNSKGCIRSVDEPAPTMTGAMDNGNFRWFDEANAPEKTEGRLAARRADLPEWCSNRPSTTIVGSFKPEIVAAPGYRTTVSRQNALNSIRVTVQEAGLLQSFPTDFPWQGAKGKQFLQVGNAVPPLLAVAILNEAL